MGVSPQLHPGLEIILLLSRAMKVRKHPLGDLILRRRGELRYSQEALADKAGVDVKTLQGIETGVTTRPRAATLGKLATALHIDIKYLFEELPEIEKSNLAQPADHGQFPFTRETRTVELRPAGNSKAETRTRFGVFLSEFSYTRGLLTPDDFILNIDPESAARVICQDIMKLLLIFDVVHIPLGQYIFLPSSFYRRVASILLNDKDIRSLASNGFISVTFPQSNRGVALEQHIADHHKFNWKFSELLDRNDLNAILSFPKGFVFDNNKLEIWLHSFFCLAFQIADPFSHRHPVRLFTPYTQQWMIIMGILWWRPFYQKPTRLTLREMSIITFFNWRIRPITSIPTTCQQVRAKSRKLNFFRMNLTLIYML
jgi:transcriptional regulator with XRE-family HTH domain